MLARVVRLCSLQPGTYSPEVVEALKKNVDITLQLMDAEIEDRELDAKLAAAKARKAEGS